MTRMRFIAAVLVAGVTLLAAADHPLGVAPAVGEVRPAAGLRVIVNAENSVISIDRKFLSDVFLKRVTQWGHLVTIRPVDQRPDAPARRQFSEEILKRSVAAVKTYWQQAVFSGRDVPPPELDSEEEVVRYVLRNPGAIGYVSSGIDTGNARVLPVR
jgi:ABC-type phosphate transport system substrate-binding protein